MLEAIYTTATCPLTNSLELHLQIEITKLNKNALDKSNYYLQLDTFILYSNFHFNFEKS